MEDLTDVLKLESFCCLFGWLKLFLSEALSVSQSDADCCESSVVVDRKVSCESRSISSSIHVFSLTWLLSLLQKLILIEHCLHSPVPTGITRPVYSLL